MSRFAVWSRSKTTGVVRKMAPDCTIVKRKFLWVFSYNQIIYDDLPKTVAVDMADELFRQKETWQDVWVLRSNDDPEGYHDFCAEIIWKNGNWCNIAADTNSPYYWNGIER